MPLLSKMSLAKAILGLERGDPRATQQRLSQHRHDSKEVGQPRSPDKHKTFLLLHRSGTSPNQKRRRHSSAVAALELGPLGLKVRHKTFVVY